MKMDSKFEDDMEMEDVGKGKKCKVMTMEDVAEQLTENLADEIADSKQYLHMAKVAERAEDSEDCHYLTEMAKDEYTHAYYIHNFMVEHDICVPEEQERDFERLKETMKEFF